VGIFRRKSKWEKFSNGVTSRSTKLAAGAVRNSSIKAGAVAATGTVALTAASAAVSAMRRKVKS
jgi:hypothetical protein